MKTVYDLYIKLHEHINDIYDYELQFCDISSTPITSMYSTGKMVADDKKKKIEFYLLVKVGLNQQ